MKTRLLSLAAVIAITFPVVTRAAEDPVVRGEAIARESDRRDLGFGDSKAVLTMVLENRKGQTSQHRLRVYTLEVPDPNDGDKSMVIFDHPRDIRGTADALKAIKDAAKKQTEEIDKKLKKINKELKILDEDINRAKRNMKKG